MVFLCVHCYKHPHRNWPPFWCYTAHTWRSKPFFLMMEIVAWNIPLSNGKTDNSLLGVWFWGSVSHFRSQPFVTGSYTKSEERHNGKGQKEFSIYFKVSFLFKRQRDRQTDREQKTQYFVEKTSKVDLCVRIIRRTLLHQALHIKEHNENQLLTNILSTTKIICQYWNRAQFFF